MRTIYVKDKVPKVGKLYHSNSITIILYDKNYNTIILYDENYKMIRILKEEEVLFYIGDTRALNENNSYRILTSEGIIGMVYNLDTNRFKEVL